METPSRLLLVRPPGTRRRPTVLLPPLGLLYVAAGAREAGHDVEIVDATAEGLDWEGLAARCRSRTPDVIGLGGFTPTFTETARAARLLRPLANSLVVGGPHASRHAGSLVPRPEIDAVVVGEAEETIGPLLDWLAAGSGGPPPAGVMAAGRRFQPRPRQGDLDRLPGPALDLIEPRRYRYPLATGRGVAALVTGRGCPHRCVFCDKTITGSKPRLQSPDRVVAQLGEISGRHGLGYAVLFDDDFAVDRDRVLAICDGIRSAGLRLRWKCEVRADAMDPELARAMRGSGCHLVSIGIETASAAGLETLRKDLDPATIRAAFAACRDAGLQTLAYALVGIPGEGPDDVRRTAAFCREVGATWTQFSTISPYEGTEIHRLAVERGWLAQSGVRSPADAEQTRPTLVAPPWTEESLHRAMWRAHAGFYLHPASLARQFSRALADRAITSRLAAGIGLAGWLAGGAIGPAHGGR